MNTQQPEALRLADWLEAHLYLAPSTFDDAAKELRRLHALVNTPELIDFSKAVQLEAAHQRERWGSDHDGGKSPEDWYWLIGYLAGRALGHHKEAERLQAQLQAGYQVSLVDGTMITNSIAYHREKAVHHTITAAAACANWHAAVVGKIDMRPGVDPAAVIAAAGVVA